MSLPCSESIARLQNIKDQRANLEQQESDFLIMIKSGGITRQDRMQSLRDLFKTRSGLTKSIKELKEDLNPYCFIIKGAINPYAEVMKEGGITDASLIAEKKDITFYLQTILDQDLESYRKANCDIWAYAIPEKIEELNLTKEKIAIIKSRIELGEIPIVMPGRSAQIRGIFQVLNFLRPEYIKDNKLKKSKPSTFLPYIEKLISLSVGIIYGTAERDMSHVRDNFKDHDGAKALQQLCLALSEIPEDPYIFLASISRQNDVRTRNKSLIEQQEELRLIQKESLAGNIYCQSIGEYLALQKLFVERAQRQTSKKLKSLMPLDEYGQSEDGTYSSFINLPISKHGHVPVGLWDPDNNNIRVAWCTEHRFPKGGFRTAVRI